MTCPAHTILNQPWPRIGETLTLRGAYGAQVVIDRHNQRVYSIHRVWRGRVVWTRVATDRYAAAEIVRSHKALTNRELFGYRAGRVTR